MKKYKQVAALVLCAVLMSCVGAPFCSVFADSWNGEGTGGEVGSAVSNTYVINAEQYSGIRVSIVDDAGARVEGTRSVDYMRKVAGGEDAWHFAGKKNKIEYRACKNANDISLEKGGYTFKSASEFVSQLGPTNEMPIIVLKHGSNIQDIRNWLTSQEKRSVPNKIAKDCGLEATPASEVNPDPVNLYRNTLCKQNYHILIEPVGSIVVQGTPYVGTATELAFLGQRSGCAWNYLGSYIDMQLPLSMYLSYTQLGIPAARFTASRQSREDIITYLGCAITTYQKNGEDITDSPYDRDDDPQPEIETPPADYTYHLNTDVYSSVKITNDSGADIKDGWVSFTLSSGAEYRMEDIALPAGGSQLAYFRWRTPKTGSSCTVLVEASEGITASTGIIRCRFQGTAGIEPPDPTVRDTNPHWRFPQSALPESNSAGATWGHWDETAGADKQISVWYYHENGSWTYHRTGHTLVSEKEIPDSAFYHLISREHEDAQFLYGDWELHENEEWVAPDPGLYDIDGQPVSSRTVVEYLGATPYRTKVTKYSRSGLSWYNKEGKSAANKALSYYNGTRFYTKNGGSPLSSEPSPSAEGDVLTVYTYQKSFSADGVSSYLYKGVSYTASYGKWNIVSSYETMLSVNYGESKTVSSVPTEKTTYVLLEICPSTKTYTGASCIQDSRNDTAVWSKRTGYTDYYTWKQRTVRMISEARDTYTYEMYDTSWTDDGSYWSSGKTTLSTQDTAWKWIDESAAMVTSAGISPAGSCRTSGFRNGMPVMRSGYGIEIDAVPVITTLGHSRAGRTEVTSLQRSDAWFPEFGWQTYCRVLTGNGTFHFPVNRYSRTGARVHFTPIWYPDGTPYSVRVHSYDLWTPAGQLSCWVQSGSILIDGGSCYDDWAITLRP